RFAVKIWDALLFVPTSWCLQTSPYPLKASKLRAAGHRFDLRFLRPLRADLSIRKSSSFFPPLIAVTSQRGFTPRPAQVSPERLRFFGGPFLPFKWLPPPRTILAPPPTRILSSCF